MEAAVAGVGKAVLNCLLSGAKASIEQDVATRQGIQRGVPFLTDELAEMQSFLSDADDERNKHKVPRSKVKYIRDLAYEVEDCLQDFAVHSEKPSWWRIPRARLEQHRIAEEMKGLRGRVEDMAERKSRYRLVEDSSSEPERPIIFSPEMFVIQQARRDALQQRQQDRGEMDDQRDRAIMDLTHLMDKGDKDLTVIAVWGSSDDLGKASIIKGAYDRLKCKMFECHARVRMMHPLNVIELLQIIIRQFYVNSLQCSLRTQEDDTLRTQVLHTMGTMKEDDLADAFKKYLNEKRYLIVLDDLYTIDEWERIKSCFPNKMNGSRIMLSTEQVEVASLCIGAENVALDHKHLSSDPNVYAFYKKVSQNAIYLTEAESSSNRARPMTMVLEESHVVGREKEKCDIIKLVTSQTTYRFKVISVWGMGGIGKTTLVKDIYRNKLSGMFEKCACITVIRPFSLVELLRSLVMQLGRESSEKKGVVGLMGSAKKALLLIPHAELIKELIRLLERKRCLIVLDNVSSTLEWNLIIPYFLEMENTSRIIVTTREEDIAKQCSRHEENIYKLNGLEYNDACDLFSEKVFKATIDLDKHYPELVEQAELILRKCSRLPLAIVTIGGFLANQPKTVMEWRKLNEHISAELEMNPELETVRTFLMRSYDGLPYHLKSCFLYMPIFPENYRVGRKRLVRRWTAEGYSREVCGKSAEEISDSYFMELISRSMFLPYQQSIHGTEGIDSCQVHDLIREIGISKSMEENLVYTLEEGCSSKSQSTVRHLAINGNWEGDQSELQSTVDMSRVRSVTVFGKYKSFFISDKMSRLRVLDLEDTTGLRDHHLKHIWKLLHLRYLSLRGCHDIYHLPDSLGNLRELQTLDVRGTRIIKLPKSIINLQKLNNLCAGREMVNEDVSYEVAVEGVMSHRACLLPLALIFSCLVCCAPQLIDEDDLSRCDACTFVCCSVIPSLAMHLDKHGVLVPRGIRNLKVSLRTLGVVNIARRSKDVLKDIKELTRLRKLGVTGVNKENGQELCSTIVGLSRLESLSIRPEGEPGLFGCLDGWFSFPQNLQKLKLYGNLVKLPEWIQGLNNLVKLKLRSSRISEHDADAAMQVLGNLPNLASLHLLEMAFGSEGVHLNFCPGTFQSLVVLELILWGSHTSVKFEGGAAPRLELLEFDLADINSRSLSGLPSLSGLKEVVLKGGYGTSELGYVQAELALHRNRPVLRTK